MLVGSRSRDRSWCRWRRPAGPLVAVILAASCAGGGDGEGSEPGQSPSGGEAAEDEARSDTPSGPFPLGRRTLELVDDSRPTPAVPAHGLAATEERGIPVVVVYPAADPPTASTDATGTTAAAAPAVEDAPVADGRFPLVVFAHGVNNVADYFIWLAEHWAREGYVVAVPTFPASRAPIAHFDDYVNQPADVSFVIDGLLARNEGEGDDSDPLAGHVDGERIAVGGYSLGAVTVLGVTMNTCCVDERIDATIAVAGGPLPFEGGSYEDTPATPLLIVQGGRDTTAPIGAGDAVFDIAQPPVHYLQLTEADHVNIWGEELLLPTTTAFLDAHLQDEPEALDRLATTVETSGRGELHQK